jgi:hypothetical protein
VRSRIVSFLPDPTGFVKDRPGLANIA